MIKPPDIAIVGEIMIECMIRLPRLPERNSTEIVDAQQLRLGGPAVNVAWHLGHLGRRPRLVGLLGDSDTPLLHNLFDGTAVDIAGMIQHDGASDLLVSFLTHEGHYSAYARSGLTAEAADRMLAHSGNPDCLVLNGSRHAPIRNIFCRLVQKTWQAMVVFNPSYSIYLYEAHELRTLIETADVTTLNEDESACACRLLGVQDLRALSRAAAGCIIGTRGKEGADVWKAGDHSFIPSLLSVEGDVVGAGDAFLSGFVHELLSGRTVNMAGEYGAATASFVVESRNPRPIIKDDSVRKRLETGSSR